MSGEESPALIAGDSSLFLARFQSDNPRSWQGSPKTIVSPSVLSSSFDAVEGEQIFSSRCFGLSWVWGSVFGVLMMISALSGNDVRLSQSHGSRSMKDGRWWRRLRRRTLKVVLWAAVVGLFFLLNLLMFRRLQHGPTSRREVLSDALNTTLQALPMPQFGGKRISYEKVRMPRQVMYSRLLTLATHSLADAKSEPRDLWKETLMPSIPWKPCADQRSWEPSEGTNGYILVSANGGISQQRVAICNAVAIARLLNSTLVLPQFLYSSVWQDSSQFSDIYNAEHFINHLKDDIKIVKELPVELQSLDLEAIGSLMTDAEIKKEEKPSFYVKKILPVLLKNKVVHLTGFGNRLAFDPIPFNLQRLRCRCNFHALQFVKRIQETGGLLIQRMRRHRSQQSQLEHSLVGSLPAKLDNNERAALPSVAYRYLSIHLRFEIDMAAYSLCYFGGGDEEMKELEAYRQVHFPALTAQRKSIKMPSPEVLRSEGQCPLTPEEAVLMLAALGYKQKTRIYVAGADIYGGKLRMAALKSLYPNLETKESLLSSAEIEPFRHFSSQLAALDFIACAAADAFAMTDSGSQLSSLVAGYRVYYGGTIHPTIRPNKRRLASAFARNSTIKWKYFEASVRKAVKQSKMVEERPKGRSIYRHPRCLECMCPVPA